MATKTKTSTFVYFGGKLHTAKDNADASRQFMAVVNHVKSATADSVEPVDSKEGRVYTDGKLTAHVSHYGNVWDVSSKEAITASIKLAEDELDDKAVIASFTKLLLKHLTEGDDVSEQLHALNYLRQQAGMKPIVIPEGLGAAPKQQEAPKSAPAPHKEPTEGKAGPVMALDLRIPFAFSPLPDNTEWTNRFDIKSESSDRLYRIAQNKKKRFWGCSCPGWISRKKCKHLTALGLPGEYTPYEPKLKSGSVKTAGNKWKLYTGPTIVKQTADALVRAGINVTVEGTEHVHFLADGSTEDIIKKLREILGPQWGVKFRDVQHLGAEMIHSDNDLGLKLEPADTKNVPPVVQGPEAGPSNDEMFANGHAENGNEGSPVYDGNLKSPERANVNAIREALETQQEMEVGKPIEQKQKEVAVAEKVQDAALAEGAGAIVGGGAAGAQEVSAKPGTQIIINVASMKKVSYVSHCPGHKNSKGESAEWCVKSHKDDHIISSHKTEAEAKQHLQDMHAHSGSLEKDAAARVRISDTSGVDSGKEGTIIPWDDPKAQMMGREYPFVGGRTPQGMGWIAILLDDGTVTTVPKGNVQMVKRSTEECPECEHSLPHPAPYGCEVERGDAPGGEGDHGPYGSYALPPCGCKYGIKTGAAPIGGEPEMQPGATAGHAGGMFGGTDLEGPSFHVGFTFKGYHREASFTSVAEAEKFITAASRKFGKLAGDWTMKCPQCGKTASKDNPQDDYKCACGWSSNTKSSGLKKAEVTPHRPLTCYILDAMGDTEEAGHVNTTAEAAQWFKERGINIYSDVESKDNGQDTTFIFRRTSSKTASDPAHRTLVYTLLKTGPKTTGQIENALGGGKHTNKAYPILQEMAKEGLVAHKQMRWSLKQAGYEGGHQGWTNYSTFYVNALIDNTEKSLDTKFALAEQAIDKGVKPEQLAETFKKIFGRYERQARKEHEENNADSRQERGEYERMQLEGQKRPSTGNKGKDIAQDLWDLGMESGMVGGEEPFEEVNWVEIAKDAIDNRRQERGLPEEDEFAKQVGISLASMRKATIRVKVGGAPQKGTPEWHQLQVAIKSLKMPEAMLGVMGGPSKEQAAQLLARYGLRWDGEKVVKTAGDGMAKTETELEKEAGFNFFFPGQVLKEFYPEIQHEIVDYPNATNQPMSGAGNPEIVGDDGGEIEGMLDDALGNQTIVEMIQLPADVGEPMPMAASKKRAADYVPTKPGGAMGIGRDGKPQVLDGAPLRKEMDIRGYMFTDEFYGQYDGIPGAAMAVASKTAAEGTEAKQFGEFLSYVCGEIAATMVAAFKVTSRPLLDKIPGIGEIQLDTIEQGSQSMPLGQITQGGRVKFLMDQLNDGEIKNAINEAWAQSAVWHEGGDGGFVYEVFVRPETIDTDSMKMKYKFVCGTKE